MRIKKVEISNILGVKSASLSFSSITQVYVVQCVPDCPIRSTFSTAIELIVGAKYASIESLNALTDIYRGFVRLTFIMAKRNYGGDVQDANDVQRTRMINNQKQFYELVACRDFKANADDIEFSIDNQTKQFCSTAAFLAKFFTGVEYIFPYLNSSDEISSGNLLNLILKSLKCKWRQDQELFELYIESCSTKIHQCQPNEFLKQLTTCVLNTCVTNYVIQKSHVLKICNHIRTIFEFITCDEYSVWFFIPYHGKYLDMNDLNDITIEELNLDATDTCVRIKNCNISGLILWVDLDEMLKELLMIALDLALGFACKRDIIFIRKIEAIKEHQTIELYSAAYLQGKESTEEINRNNKNYLQRVIDVCNSMGMTAIIDYSASLPLHPNNANIITCIKEGQLDEQYWTMKGQDTKIYDFGDVVKCIREFF